MLEAHQRTYARSVKSHASTRCAINREDNKIQRDVLRAGRFAEARVTRREPARPAVALRAVLRAVLRGIARADARRLAGARFAGAFAAARFTDLRALPRAAAAVRDFAAARLRAGDFAAARAVRPRPAALLLAAFAAFFLGIRMSFTYSASGTLMSHDSQSPRFAIVFPYR